MTWDRLADTDDPREYNLLTVPDYAADGDPWAGMNDTAYSLDPLLDLWETLPGGELNFPPDYPKMPGEPPACSRRRRWPSTGMPTEIAWRADVDRGHRRPRTSSTVASRSAEFPAFTEYLP